MRPIRVTARDYDRAPRYRVNIIHANADLMERVYALFRLEQFDDAYTIAIWAWELNALRPDWFGSFAAIDEVWTPSDFNTAVVAAMAPVPARTINHVVEIPGPDKDTPAEHDRTWFGLPDGFLFLTVFDVGSSLDRKNPFAVIDAFTHNFGTDDPAHQHVHLILKFHSGVDDPRALRQLLAHLRGRARIIIRSEKMTDAEMAGLQACADCLVSPHRSEGFGLNIAEFMALGKPVIVTGYAGSMDFTTEDNSFLVAYTLQPLQRQSGPYLPGYLWAEPDEAELSAQMRRVVEHPEEAASRGAAAAATIRQRLSAPAIGATMLARLEELGLRTEVPAFVSLLGGSKDLVLPPYRAVAPLTERDRQQAEPTISIIVPVYNVPPKWLVRCIESVRAQTWERWELCLADDASTKAETVDVLRRYQGLDPRIRIMRLAQNGGISVASNAAVQMATGSYLLMLDNDDELTPDALDHIARAIIDDPTIDVLYADEDKLDTFGRRCDHYHKPDWSPEHLESVMYTLHPVTMRTSLFLEIGCFRPEFTGAQDYDLMLRLSRHTSRIHHIPEILYHWRMIPGSASAEVDAKPEALNAGKRALEQHVATKYGEGEATVEPGLLPGLYRVRHRIRIETPVSIMITTNNSTIELPGRKRFVMIDNLIASIVKHTTYRNYRIVVIDNANSTPEQIANYRNLGMALHSYRGPMKPFNYSDKANFSLRCLETEHIVMMNDDMEVMDGDWLSALLEFSQNPEIGAVGCKLFHADGTIQHAGVVLGVGGGSAHVYHGFPGDFIGYNGYTHLIRNFSVLTAACLATKRSVMQEIGGFDRALAIDFNDTDVCLKMRRLDYRIVFTPFSRLYHFESATAVRTSQDPAEVRLFQARWAEIIANDPYYNPNLSHVRHDYALR